MTEEEQLRQQAERIQDLENLVGMLLVHCGIDYGNVRASSGEEFRRLFDRLHDRPVIQWSPKGGRRMSTQGEDTRLTMSRRAPLP